MVLSAESAVVAGGVMTLLVGIGHWFFPRLFGWGQEWPRLSVKNHRILYTIHIFVIPLLLLLGYVSLAHTEELTSNPGLGRTVVSFCAMLWLARWLWQIYYFRPSMVRGKDPAASWLIPLHYGLTLLLFLLFACYLVPVVAWLG